MSSAAVKLKALEATLKTDDAEEWEGAMIDLEEALADALPQIVAVVEAAERQAGDGWARVELRTALAALDEALS